MKSQARTLRETKGVNKLMSFVGSGFLFDYRLVGFESWGLLMKHGGMKWKMMKEFQRGMFGF
jgi:hypothetical protein